MGESVFLPQKQGFRPKNREIILLLEFYPVNPGLWSADKATVVGVSSVICATFRSAEQHERQGVEGGWETDELASCQGLVGVLRTVHLFKDVWDWQAILVSATCRLSDRTRNEPDVEAD